MDERSSTMLTSPKWDRFGAENTSFREEALLIGGVPLASEPGKCNKFPSCIMQLYFCTYLKWKTTHFFLS